MTFTKINRIYNDINESSSPDPDPGTIDLQSKSVEITENGNSIITADPNYDGLREVNLSVNVPIPIAYEPPEFDITKFRFGANWESENTSIINCFNGINNTILKNLNNNISGKCYILYYNNQIILSFTNGAIPNGAYYCNNNENYSYIDYDNIHLYSDYIRYYYYNGRSNRQRYGPEIITLFGKLINLPE